MSSAPEAAGVPLPSRERTITAFDRCTGAPARRVDAPLRDRRKARAWT